MGLTMEAEVAVGGACGLSGRGAKRPLSPLVANRPDLAAEAITRPPSLTGLVLCAKSEFNSATAGIPAHIKATLQKIRTIASCPF
jgi:hypothetical protein